MEKQNLDRLINAYSVQNLNKISSALIAAYRRREFEYLLSLCRNLGQKTGDRTINELFSALIMQFHPDRRMCVIDQIRKDCTEGQTEKGQSFESIFSVLDFIDLHPAPSAASCSGKQPAADSSARTAPFRNTARHRKSDMFHDFISALKQKEYGNLDVTYHILDLQNLEGDLELSGYSMIDLSGLEHCEYLTALNLSYNNIHDISQLSSLTLLEHIDLSFNRITHVDALSGMSYLRTADLSFNEICDLSPLMNLEQLEYINCAGNRVPESQRYWFQKRGVIII